jgi:small subunit ribosomal protein S20
MAIKKSAKKELRKNLKRRLLNLDRKKKIKISIKNFLRALKEKNKEKAEEYLRLAFKNLDKAAKRFYKKNKASRIKSRLSKKFNLVFANQ